MNEFVEYTEALERQKMEREAGPRQQPEDITDSLGFRVVATVEEQLQRERCEMKQQKRARKWKSLEGQRALKASEWLKKRIRKGVPPALRPWIWFEVSGAQQAQAHYPDNYYEAMIRLGMDPGNAKQKQQIDLDLPRTFPSNAWIQGAEGQERLERVLVAYSVHNTDSGYCQSMNYLAGFLLLVLKGDEEKSFWVMVTLIDRILYKDTYAHNLAGCQVEMQSLRELVAKKLPKVAAHLDAMQCDMSIIATDWFLCLYTTSLPAETAARVWDTLLHEGPKVLYRVALAVLSIYEEDLLRQTNAGELLQVVKKSTMHLHNRDQLLKVAFKGLGSLPMKRIDRLRRVQQVAVDSEMKRRNLPATQREALQIAIARSKQVQEQQQQQQHQRQPQQRSGNASSSTAASGATDEACPSPTETSTATAASSGASQEPTPPPQPPTKQRRGLLSFRGRAGRDV